MIELAEDFHGVNTALNKDTKKSRYISPLDPEIAKRQHQNASLQRNKLDRFMLTDKLTDKLTDNGLPERTKGRIKAVTKATTDAVPEAITYRVVTGATTEAVTRPRINHGQRYHPLYWCWINMIRRCTMPNNPKYRNYGAKGITVCKDWFNPSVFFRDMGDRPDGLSLVRTDVERGYYKDNCSWGTKKDLSKSRSNLRIIESLPLKLWCKQHNLSVVLTTGRYNRGWTPYEMRVIPKDVKRADFYADSHASQKG